jgi:hypothetical protein
MEHEIKAIGNGVRLRSSSPEFRKIGRSISGIPTNYKKLLHHELHQTVANKVQQLFLGLESLVERE